MYGSVFILFWTVGRTRFATVPHCLACSHGWGVASRHSPCWWLGSSGNRGSRQDGHPWGANRWGVSTPFWERWWGRWRWVWGCYECGWAGAQVQFYSGGRCGWRPLLAEAVLPHHWGFGHAHDRYSGQLAETLAHRQWLLWASCRGMGVQGWSRVCKIGQTTSFFAVGFVPQIFGFNEEWSICSRYFIRRKELPQTWDK